DHCKKPIANKKGYVCVSYADINRYEKSASEWKTEHQQPNEDGLILIPASAYFDYPSCAQWITTHLECDLNPDSLDYWMPVERLRTYERLLQFTAHIMGKTWIDSTNWPVLLRRTI